MSFYNSSHTIRWLLSEKTVTKYIKECTSIFAINFDLQHFDNIQSNSNICFGNLKDSIIGYNNKQIVSFLSALNLRLAIEKNNVQETEKDKCFYTDRDTLEVPKLGIFVEILNSEEETPVGYRLWFAVHDSNYDIGKTMFELLSDNENDIKNKEDADLRDRGRRGR
jgi:hypothetical protein